MIAQLVRTLAQEVETLNDKVADVDRLIEARFRTHELAEIVASMPGIDPLLGTGFLATVGNDLADSSSPDGLAAFAGLAPVPHGSGKRNGNLHRPHHCHRGLQRVLSMSALTSVRHDPNSRAFYDRKRAEGKRHTQSVTALARRRVNILWALIRGGRLHEVAPPRPTS
ncbi:IS110 family transposase [Streptomyces sp. NRRL F-525]|uniref:IS110 family transposase n=1 Tax=Streptomyces sp. NRRL F-525 TaxID=1463861 RepID=UPI00068FB48F|nr:IS110 family transposase [Streptomyces sp. NRRL F-525]